MQLVTNTIHVLLVMLCFLKSLIKKIFQLILILSTDILFSVTNCSENNSFKACIQMILIIPLEYLHKF